MTSGVAVPGVAVLFGLFAAARRGDVAAVPAAAVPALHVPAGLREWVELLNPEPGRFVFARVDSSDLDVRHDDARALARGAAREHVTGRVADGRAAAEARLVRQGQPGRLAAHAPAVRRLDHGA